MTSIERLQRDYEQCKSRNDWQGMAQAHLLLRQSRSNHMPDHDDDTNESEKEEEGDWLIGAVIFFGIVLIGLAIGWFFNPGWCFLFLGVSAIAFGLGAAEGKRK